MSTLLQRGEPALVSKWYRTKILLACGVDLVVELPYAFSTQIPKPLQMALFLF